MSGNVYVDKGLRAYFVNIYQYIGLNLALSGAVAFFVSTNATLFHIIVGSPLFYVVMFAPIGIAWYMGSRMNEMSVGRMQVLFWIYGALIGASLSTIFVVYTSESIFK